LNCCATSLSRFLHPYIPSIESKNNSIELWGAQDVGK
jgi:hypothetical protein